MPARFAWCCVLASALAEPAPAANGLLAPTPASYVQQADGVRRSIDRPWTPAAGQLGNLRHLQISARDCVVRVVSGNENRVYPGSVDVIVVERSRVLDDDPGEQPPPRDVLLAGDHAQACPGPGSCGVSITAAKDAPRVGAAKEICFTVQLASAHDLLVGGDGLTVLVDGVRQPALRIALNPGARQQLWLEDVDIGLLSIAANAPARVGGSGRIDALQASSSNRASAMYLHGFDAKHIGISTTTTGTQWSIRIGADTTAGYHQPARAGGRLAENYPIEIDGPLERLQVPAGRVDPHPLGDTTRNAARALRDSVLARAGPRPTLPASDPMLASAAIAATRLPADPRERVARVVARILPASVRITDVVLWEKGGRLEGIAPDAATSRDVGRRLRESGEFTHISGGGGATPRDGGYAFSVLMHFSCNAPGQPSICSAGDPNASGAYSEMQMIETLEALLAPRVTLDDARLDGNRIYADAHAATEADAREALARIRAHAGLFRVSASGIGPSPDGASWTITAHLALLCSVPPTPGGICAVRDPVSGTLQIDPDALPNVER